jgi:hypothetical protein
MCWIRFKLDGWIRLKLSGFDLLWLTFILKNSWPCLINFRYLLSLHAWIDWFVLMGWLYFLEAIWLKRSLSLLLLFCFCFDLSSCKGWWHKSWLFFFFWMIRLRIHWLHFGAFEIFVLRQISFSRDFLFVEFLRACFLSSDLFGKSRPSSFGYGFSHLSLD